MIVGDSKSSSRKDDQTQAQQGDGGAPPPTTPTSPQTSGSPSGNTIFKSGPMSISSRGLGWTTWRKRWFVLTRTSLVFFRSEPNSAHQRGGEVNSLGGIELDNSGSVVVKTDKKLLTVLFHDGSNARAFTFKAETLEDLNDWKAALENALAQAPSPAQVVGQYGVSKSDQADAINANDKQSQKSTVLGAPISLSLADANGAPTFLEKALLFIEEHGKNVEGILRQAADVEDVERRIREYEEGKSEFSAEEDAHVIADCIKCVIREFQSPPVPTSCCTALVSACRADHASRADVLRTTIFDKFPEPNRRFLQSTNLSDSFPPAASWLESIDAHHEAAPSKYPHLPWILKMMQIVASNESVNRMGCQAVAACMAPLLLRPLLAGECDAGNFLKYGAGGCGSSQLLQAAAAANRAQAICTALLNKYSEIFRDSEEENDVESQQRKGDETLSQNCTDDHHKNGSTGTCSRSDESQFVVNNQQDDKDMESEKPSSGSVAHKSQEILKVIQNLPLSEIQTSIPRNHDSEMTEKVSSQSSIISAKQTENPAPILETVPTESICVDKPMSDSPDPKKTTNESDRPPSDTSARKGLAMGSIDFPVGEDEAEIEKLQTKVYNLENRFQEEVNDNDVLEARLDKRKKTLHEQRLSLEKDVAKLEEKLHKEIAKKRALKAGLVPEMIDEKTNAELTEIAQAEVDVSSLMQRFYFLSNHLNRLCEENSLFVHPGSNEQQYKSFRKTNQKDKRNGVEKNEEESGSKGERLPDEVEKETGKNEDSSSPNKHNFHNQHSDSTNKPQSQDQQSLCSNDNSSSKPDASSDTDKCSTRVECETHPDETGISETGAKQGFSSANKHRFHNLHSDSASKHRSQDQQSDCSTNSSSRPEASSNSNECYTTSEWDTNPDEDCKSNCSHDSISKLDASDSTNNCNRGDEGERLPDEVESETGKSQNFSPAEKQQCHNQHSFSANKHQSEDLHNTSSNSNKCCTKVEGPNITTLSKLRLKFSKDRHKT